KVEPIRIDFDGLADRIVQVPVAPGNYSGLRVVEGKLHWLSAPNRGMLPPGEGGDEEPRGSDLQTFDSDKEKVSTVASGVLAYDAKMHGVDWEGVWKQYGSLADRMSTRDDLEDLLGEMLGELNVGHAYHWGGDLRRGKPIGTGLLAADLDYDPASGFWRIKKI